MTDDAPGPADTQPIDPIDLPPVRSARTPKARAAKAEPAAAAAAAGAPASGAAADPAATSAARSTGTEPATSTKQLPVIITVVPPKKKRRIWPWVTLVVVLVVLVVGFFVADNLAKQYARDYIKDRLVAVLHIDPKTPVKVTIGSGSVLLQALSGHLNEVDATADRVTFGTLTGSATLHAENMPLDANAPVEKLDLTFSVDEKDLSVLATNLSGLDLDSITLAAPDIVAATSFTLFGFSIPIDIGLTPSTATGQIVFTPSSITVNGQTFSAQQLTENPLFGSFARTLLQQQSYCVAELFPTALTVTDVDVVKKNLVVKINGDGIVLGSPDLATMGTCQKQE
ncbi:hypothetical protein BH11ACT3_BH11ACT3_03470 [soil metagenome]